MYPLVPGMQNLIDTKLILQEFGVDPDKYINAQFLDVIIEEGSKNPYLKNDKDLYPVLPTNKNFAGPYLTPRKHVEYCTFWALTSLIGFAGMGYILKKF